jgi:predicted O-methyltransferase YrrM
MNNNPIPFPELTLDSSHSLNPFEKSVLVHLLAASRPQTILELGVYKGITSKFIHQWLTQFNIKATIVGFDLDEVFSELVKDDSEIAALVKEDKLKLIPGFLPDTLVKFLSDNRSKIDLILIDAKHDYPSVYGELSLIWPHLSDHGFIICHDYHKPRIQYAVEKFSRKTGAQYLPILANPEHTLVYSSLVILTKPKLKFSYKRWLIYHFQVKNWRGYYLLKKLFRKFFESID